MPFLPLLLMIACDLPAADGIAHLLRALPYEAFRIPSGGMNPNLLVGDHVYADERAFDSREPLRGEIVVFRVALSADGVGPVDRHPNAPTETFIKRMIGLPGDEIEWGPDGLILNGEPIREIALDEAFRTVENRSIPVHETSLDGVAHRILKDPARAGPERGRILVEAGRYFLVGDFRTNSLDSRSWGTVRRSDLIGPVVLRYYSGDQESGGFVWDDLRVAR